MNSEWGAEAGDGHVCIFADIRAVDKLQGLYGHDNLQWYRHTIPYNERPKRLVAIGEELPCILDKGRRDLHVSSNSEAVGTGDLASTIVGRQEYLLSWAQPPYVLDHWSRVARHEQRVVNELNDTGGG